MIQYFFEDIPPFAVQASITRWLEDLIFSEEKKLGAVNYIFCSDEYLLEVNRQYLQHDYYTDIITFDYGKGKIISGDIFVSLLRIQENAQLLAGNPEEEFRRVMAHGLLHLCGYKDKTPEEQQAMRQKEDYYLNFF